jgi:hypothetical protein
VASQLKYTNCLGTRCRIKDVLQEFVQKVNAAPGILPRIKICGNEIFSLMFLPPIILGSSDDRNPPN